MKKTLLVLAVCSAFGVSVFAAGPVTGVSGSTGSLSAGASSSSLAGAASTGNGTAFTATRGGQISGATVANSAGTSLAGGQLGGQVTIGGTAYTAGYAESYTVTTGSGMAGSLSFGQACADSAASGGFLAINGARGEASGAATSRNMNLAGTASFGNGEAYRGNESGNFSAFSAHADAGAKVGPHIYPTDNLIVNTAASAQSDSFNTVWTPITVGSAFGVGLAVNGGSAWALANATVGNSCSTGCDNNPPDMPKTHLNNGFGNGDQGAPGNSLGHNNGENGPRGNPN